MAVQVSDICDRCGRATPVHMSNEELVTETAKRQNIEATVKALEEQVRATDPELLPSLFVAYKVPGGKLLVKAQISVCNPDEEGKRSCTKRVMELIADLFPLPADERAPRTPRKPKVEKKEKNGDKGRGPK